MMMRSIPTSLTSGRLYCKDEFVTEEIWVCGEWWRHFTLGIERFTERWSDITAVDLSKMMVCSVEINSTDSIAAFLFAFLVDAKYLKPHSVWALFCSRSQLWSQRRRCTLNARMRIQPAGSSPDSNLEIAFQAANPVRGWSQWHHCNLGGCRLGVNWRVRLKPSQPPSCYDVYHKVRSS
jgi:hypothetical protein